jgi:hypothetical protein
MCAVFIKDLPIGSIAYQKKILERLYKKYENKTSFGITSAMNFLFSSKNRPSFNDFLQFLEILKENNIVTEDNFKKKQNVYTFKELDL